MKSTVASLTLLVVALAAACVDGDNVPEFFSPPSPDFHEEDQTGSNKPRVMFKRDVIADGRIQVTVTVADVEASLSALAMKFRYPSEFSRLVECNNGEVFGSAACVFGESDTDRSLIYLGLTELGGAGTVPPAGPIVLARLTFVVFDSGAGAISIEGQNLGGSDGSALIGPADNVVIADWYGGVLSGG